jgi:hypothetical protein
VAILLIFREEDPVLVNVTLWAALVVPTTWLPKAKLAGERLTTGGFTATKFASRFRIIC